MMAKNKEELGGKRKRGEADVSSRIGRAQLASLLEDLAAQNPGIKFVPGNDKKKLEAQYWLDDARARLVDQEKAGKEVARAGIQVKRKTKQEFYGKAMRKGMPAYHVYDNIPFCRKELLPTSCEAVKPLTDGEYRLDVKDCHDFERFVGRHDYFLRNIAQKERDSIKRLGEFHVAEIRSWPSEKQLEWYERSGSPSAQDMADRLEKNGLLKNDAFEFSFSCVCLHDQTDDTKNGITAYASHMDKVGNIVCFYGLSGVSYNFVAMPSVDGEQKEHAEFETNVGSYDLYHAYKESCQGAERTAIEMYEAEFMKEATEERLPRVRVYKLSGSDKLVFAAAHYLHGTIIPKSEQDGSRRALLVFHDLIPYS